MSTTALIVAAGAGARMGSSSPKAFLDLGGRPLVQHSLDTFQAHPGVDHIVLMVPAAVLAEAGRIAAAYPKVLAVAAGGARRQDTVELGLAHLPGAGSGGDGARSFVLVHDAARPLAGPDLIAAVLEAAERTGAALPGIAPADTVREIGPEPAGRSIRLSAGALDRRRLILAQTPQGFRTALLREAFARSGGLEVSDDAALVEAMGHPVEVVPGSPSNIKITTRGDLLIAEALLRMPRPAAARGDRAGD